jgi:phosphonate transport system substrate-binding protein
MIRLEGGKMVDRLFHMFIIFICLNSVATLLFPGRALSECEDPDTLTFSIIPTEETIQELTIYKPVIDYLARMTGKKVEFYMPASYTNVIEAMAGKWVDVAVHGPYSYVIATKRNINVQVFATYTKKKGHIQEEGPGYKAVLITRKGSRYTSIASLKGATIALTDPASASGNLIPRVVFAKVVKMPIEEYFGKIIYTGGHDLSAIGVYDGIAHAAFVATHRFDNAIERGMVKKEDFNYLWMSPVIPQDPFCYRADLCQELKNRIEETFLSLHTEPSCARFFENINANKFVRMTFSDYDIIRDLVEVAAHAQTKVY